MKYILICGNGFLNQRNYNPKHSEINAYTDYKPIGYTYVNYPPIGLLYVAKALEEIDDELTIIDLDMERKPINCIKSKILSADVVGISIHNKYTPYQKYNESGIPSIIKDMDSSIPIIIGGPYCKIHKKNTLKKISTADICVCGDGEIAIKEISKALTGKSKLSNIHGIYYRKNNTIKAGKPVTFIKNIDVFSFPARHLVEKYDYGKSGNRFLFKKPLTTIVTTRGCPYSCNFCINCKLDQNKFRSRSVDNVVSELVEINKKYRSVMIADNSFLFNGERANKIFDKIIENKLNLDLLIGGTRVDSVSKKLFKKMKKAGVKYLSFGVESATQEVLDYYDKKTNLNQIRTAVKLSNKMGFFTNGTVILGSPQESKADINRTIKFVNSLQLTSANFYVLCYVYGSDLWIDAVKNGLINKSELAVIADNSRGLGKLSYYDLLKIRGEAYKKFYLRPRLALRILKNSAISGNYNYIFAGISNLLKLQKSSFD